MARIDGILLEINSGKFTVLSDDGARLTGLSARGNLKRRGELLAGDRVSVTAQDDGGVIESYEVRKNTLIRPAMANLDVMCVTFAVTEPTPDFELIDKMCCICEHNGITPVLIATKTDLDTEAFASVKAIYAPTGYTLLRSDLDGDKRAIFDCLKTVAKNKTVAFAGCSGVGKSTLLSSLFPELKLKSGALSERIMRGRNTTRLTTLYPVDADGASLLVADTPGFSFLDFAHFDFFGVDDLFATFPEFAPCLGACRYTDCSHTEKETDCAVRDAVRDGKISKSRYASYCSLYATLKQKEADRYKT